MKKPVRKVGTWHIDQFRLGADTWCPTTVTLRGKAVRVAGIWTGTVTTTRARKSKVTQEQYNVDSTQRHWGEAAL